MTGNTLTPQAMVTSCPTPIVTSVNALVGGAGYDTLELFGVGNYDVADLAVFTGFEEVSLIDPTDPGSTVSLGARNLTLSLSAGTHTSTVNKFYRRTRAKPTPIAVRLHSSSLRDRGGAPLCKA